MNNKHSIKLFQFKPIKWLTSAVFTIGIFLFAAAPIIARPTDGDIGWPRQISKNGSTIVYYQPQIDEWSDYKILNGNFAFALTAKGEKETVGVASFRCNTLVDKDTHSVYLKDITLTSVRFPSLDDGKAKSMETLFRQMIPTEGETISLDRLTADMQQNKPAAETVTLKNDPPAIFYSTSPSILLIVQGDPALVPISKTKLQFVVNANWDLFYDKSKKQYYLLSDKGWYASATVKGPWSVAKSLPKDMNKLPAGENFDPVKKMLPPPAIPTPQQIFFSDVPAELIAIKGAPVYTKIQGTSLLYISNTDNNVFLESLSKKFYVLLSGRWFGAADLSGPWTYAGDDLPKYFAKIPENSAKSNVLSAVPGTIEASDAVLLAMIPTTAIVNKTQAESKIKIVYDGNTPQFKPIEGTSMQYAVNTQDKIIKSGDLYYLCFQAVWFMSTTPNGPWKTATSVPKEIYTIPPSSPVYNVTYVTQTNVSETTVQSNAAAGYFGAFIIGVGIGACIAYGTGWFYHPYMYWGPGAMYPVYRPWPCSYGAGFSYNPWTGGFAGGSRVCGPYGAAGTSAWYNPSTGRYGRSASVQTARGGRTVSQAYNPWTGGYAATSQGHNAYSQWGSSVASRNGQWAQTAHVTNANGTTAGYRTSTGQQGVVHTGNNGTVARGTNGTVAHGANGVTVAHGANGTYAGHDGNVYKKNASGNWSTYKNGKWNQMVGGSSGTQKELNNAAGARERGQRQTQSFQNNCQRGGGGFGGGNFKAGRR